MAKRSPETAENMGGTCYEDSITALLSGAFDGWELVHGRPTLTAAPYCEYGHAWLEKGDRVFNACTGGIYPKDLFYLIGKIDPDNDMFRYSKKEAAVQLLMSGHNGPWEGVDAE